MSNQQSSPENQEECIPYSESLFQRFRRVGGLFREGSATQVIRGIQDINLSQGQVLYGLGMQAKWGDNNSPKPSPVDVQNYILWQGWTSYQGLSSDDAAQQFIDFACQIIINKGYSCDDPYQATIEQAYRDCYQKQLSSGTSQQQLKDKAAQILAENLARGGDMSNILTNNNNVSWANPILIAIIFNLLLFSILLSMYRHFRQSKKRPKIDEQLDQKVDDQIEFKSDISADDENKFQKIDQTMMPLGY